jgi:hypothetical protein
MAANTLKLYHLADVRLGGAFPFLGQAGSGHRRQVRETFERAVDQGLDLGPSFVIISGNLFGTAFPSRDLADFAREQIGRFSARGIPVLVTAGPLDALYERTYAVGALNGLDRVTIFPSLARPVDFPDLDLCVVGASWSASPGQPIHADFLATLAPHHKRRHLIGVAHLEFPHTEEGRRALRRQIAGCGASYLAFGGSAARCDLSSERVAAWCPGGTELVAPDPGEGSPLWVAIGESVTVTPHPVNKRRFAHVALEPAAYESADALLEAIRAMSAPHLAAHVRLTGRSRINQFVDVVDLQRRLADAFLSLEIVDESQPALDTLVAAGYPDMSVAGKFLSVVLAEMDRATNADARRRTGAALRLGLSLLEGRRPS